MVKEEKSNAVEELKNLIEKYPVIGLIDMHKMPSRQMQQIKKQLRDKALMKMIKKSTLTYAIKAANKEKISEIEKFIPKQPAIFFSETEPFKIYLMISKLKSPTSAKEGDIAEDEILVSAGPTSLLPGPAISEFAKAKIPAGVEEGKIAIKKDTVVAKKGAVISKDLASILRKLKIEPVSVGMNVVAIYDKGMLYKKDSLELVGEGYINKLKEAFNNALNLSVAISYPTKDNIKYLLAKAVNAAKFIVEKIGGAS